MTTSDYESNVTRNLSMQRFQRQVYKSASTNKMILLKSPSIFQKLFGDFIRRRTPFRIAEQNFRSPPILKLSTTVEIATTGYRPSTTAPTVVRRANFLFGAPEGRRCLELFRVFVQGLLEFVQGFCFARPKGAVVQGCLGFFVQGLLEFVQGCLGFLFSAPEGRHCLGLFMVFCLGSP